MKPKVSQNEPKGNQNGTKREPKGIQKGAKACQGTFENRVAKVSKGLPKRCAQRWFGEAICVPKSITTHTNTKSAMRKHIK